MSTDPEAARAALVRRLVAERDGWRITHVVGAADTGKTTFSRRLASALAREGRTVRIDGDTGQSTVGPPATVGAETVVADGETSEEPTLWFVGSTSPSGHFLQTVVGLRRLVDRSLVDGDARLVVDASGFFEAGGGREFHHLSVEVVGPDHVVALQEDDELEPLLGAWEARSGVTVHRVGVPDAVRERSRSERRRRRRRLFRHHFRDARRITLGTGGIGLHGHVPDLADESEVADRLVGVCGADGFLLRLGRLVGADRSGGTLEIYAPPFDEDAVASVAFGSLRLEPEETGEAG